MILEYTIVSLLGLSSILSLILRRNKVGLAKMIVGILFTLVYLVFILSDGFDAYVSIYEIIALFYTSFLLITLLPKKITKNLTEYDYFELEKAYQETRGDHERLRQRFLSTISLIDEGIVFYEDSCKEVILSDKASEIFGGEERLSLEEHAKLILSSDRGEYLKAIDRASKRVPTFEVKYRIERKDKTFWVIERGHFLDVDGKKSCISVVKPLDLSIFKETSYFDIDSLYLEEKLYPALKMLLNLHKPFSFVYFELTNVPEINAKYGRAVGNLMMNDYIKYIKNNYASDISRIFRVSGIRFAMIIDDDKIYQDFHKSLISSGSMLYSIKIEVAGIKDIVKPNFGIVNYSGSKSIQSEDIVKIAEKSLEEAISSTRRNYSIFGE